MEYSRLMSEIPQDCFTTEPEVKRRGREERRRDRQELNGWNSTIQKLYNWFWIVFLIAVIVVQAWQYFSLRNSTELALPLPDPVNDTLAVVNVTVPDVNVTLPVCKPTEKPLPKYKGLKIKELVKIRLEKAKHQTHHVATKLWRFYIESKKSLNEKFWGTLNKLQ